MNGLATSCDAEVSKPPANARKSQGTDSRGGLGERDKAPGAIISNNSYIYLRAAETAASNRTQSRRGTATTSAEAGDKVTTSPRGAPPASARARIFWPFWLASKSLALQRRVFRG